jgi:hypothetical protein
MPIQTERLTKKKDRSNTFEHRTDDRRKFYQTKQWKGFRSRMKKKQRALDEDLVHDLYKTMDSVAFSSYARWLKSDDPLCVDCIKEGYIRSAQVADHKERIRAGGSAFDESNIEWRCSHHHNIKSGKEAHDNK